jgi:hypothetical protein
MSPAKKVCLIVSPFIVFPLLFIAGWELLVFVNGGGRAGEFIVVVITPIAILVTFGFIIHKTLGFRGRVILRPFISILLSLASGVICYYLSLVVWVVWVFRNGSPAGSL